MSWIFEQRLRSAMFAASPDMEVARRPSYSLGVLAYSQFGRRKLCTVFCDRSHLSELRTALQICCILSLIPQAATVPLC